ncbi:MAG TPA: YciI-like protein [Steroidobacteraceae bacterium]|nr:YciI-like protein [Steroidobacteraceae bacterium]
MKHFLLFYEAAADYLARRAEFRSAHLTKAWAASQRGELLLGGALADPVDGAVLLFKAESKRVAEEFARADPYVTSGLVRRWYVREWTTVAGEEAMTPVYPDGAAGETEVRPASTASGGGVLRLWKGRATAAKAEDYARHASQTVFPEVQSLPGHRGAYLLRRSVGNEVEFTVLTLWDSMDAVRGFAGPDPGKAVVEPAARAALSDFDETVTHYEVVTRTGEGA